MNIASSRLTKLTLCALCAMAGLTATPQSAQAMQIFNCTQTAMPVNVSHTRSGQNYGTAQVGPGQGMEWDTGAGAAFDVKLQAAGPAKRFKNREGRAVMSIARIGGQTQLLNGYQCDKMAATSQPRATQPVRSRQNSGQNNSFMERALVGAALGIIVHHATKN